MCGRFLMNEEACNDASQIAQIPQWIQGELHFGDIYPSGSSLVLKEKDHHLQGEIGVFGYYSESLKKRIINARAETAFHTRMFHSPIRHDRCVVVCAMFYEWDTSKQKVSFFNEQHSAMYLAGLMIDDSFVILTTQANSSVAPWHHRMPLVLNATQAREWILDGDKTEFFLHDTPPLLQHHLPASFIQPTLF